MVRKVPRHDFFDSILVWHIVMARYKLTLLHLALRRALETAKMVVKCYFLRVKNSGKNSKESHTNFFGIFLFSMVQTLKKIMSYAPKSARNDHRLALNDPNWGFIFGIFHHFHWFLAHFSSIFLTCTIRKSCLGPFMAPVGHLWPSYIPKKQFSSL